MKMIQRFSGVLHQGYHGNIIYNFLLPSDLSSLSVVLTYQKEHPSDPDSYFNRRRTELAPILEQYMEQPVSEDLLRREINAIKTEIQLCFMLNSVFVGNIHMPGEVKEMTISGNSASHGCIPCKNLSGMAKIIINVFHVAEDETPYQLEIFGESRDPAKIGKETNEHVEKN